MTSSSASVPLHEWVDAALHCDHEHKAPRLRILSNGQETVWLQCLDCGRGINAVPKRDFSPAELSQMPSFDPGLETAYWEKRNSLYKRVSEQRRKEAHEDWRASYSDYLDSPRWAERRRRVLERDGWRCTASMDGCTTRATEVHHLTYRHQGNEPLFDLTAVCGACHSAIHALDDARRAERGESAA